MSIFSSFKTKISSTLAVALKKSRHKIAAILPDSILKLQKIDSTTLEYIEEVLISTDMGYDVTSKIIKNLSKRYSNKELSKIDFLDIIRSTAYEILIKNNAIKSENILLQKIRDWKKNHNMPYTITFTGMNGSGKTTTIAKIAHKLQDARFKIEITCGDTFRAAATEQLIEWGNKLSIPVIHKKNAKDASGLIFESVKNAYDNQSADCCLIDTSGRLHTNTNLMGEISKIERVLSKISTSYPNESILVIDASIGQSVYNHIEEFQKHTKLTGLIVTKIDNSAKGGIILGISNKFNIPIYFLGVGETVSDLVPFDTEEFISTLFNDEILL